jgi:hypothetical protein
MNVSGVRRRGRIMRVKVEATEKGPVPSETVVTIATTVGTEDVIVHTSQVTEDGVEVGFIGSEEDGEAVLIELPRETLSGRWRIWVPRSALA